MWSLLQACLEQDLYLDFLSVHNKDRKLLERDFFFDSILYLQTNRKAPCHHLSIDADAGGLVFHSKHDLGVWQFILVFASVICYIFLTCIISPVLINLNYVFFIQNVQY